MELIVKLYSDKPSKIGIKFTHEYQAIKSYEELIGKYRNETFSLKIEPVKNKLNLQLISDQTAIRIPYKDLEYKADQVKKLLSLDSGMPVEFVHVFSKINILYVAKPFRSQQFITITDLEMITPGNFGNVM
jgi:hypothetical protein